MMPIEVAIVVYGLSENWLGGVNYFRNLVSVFDGANDQSLRLHVLTNDPSRFADLSLSSRVQVHRVPMLEHRTPAWWLRKLLNKASGRDWLLVRELKRLNVSAVVFSHVAGARQSGIRCLPWMPDFQSQRHPEFFPAEIARLERERVLEWLQDGDGLIVSSECARDDAVALFNAAPSKLHVVRFAPKLDGQALANAAQRDAILSKHGIDRPFLMLPNQYWQHKNHGLVVAALRSLRENGLARPLVVSTGKTEDLRNTAYFAEFQAAVQAANVGEDYRVLGIIDRHDMLVLMAHCQAVINPSRFEGWSTSVEEAKALGKALLLSEIPVHREQTVHWEQAEFFGVDDVQALAALLARYAAPFSGEHFSPQPRPALYKAFEHQFIELVHTFAKDR